MSILMKSLTSLGSKVVAIATLVVGAGLAQANTIQDIKFAELPGQRFEVHLDFSDAPVAPEGYTIDKPARIVLDFPDTDNALAQKKYALSFENAKDAAVVSAGGRTRLIISLDDLQPYTTRIEGNKFVLAVGTGDVNDSLAKASVGVASTLSQQTGQAKAQKSDGSNSRVSVADVDFKRNAQGAGELLFTLSDAHLDVDVDEVSSGVRVTFINTFLDQDLRRRLDVTDFATPVTQVNMDFDGRNTVVDIAAPGQFDYVAYQADNSYVISVKPLNKAELEAKNAAFAFVGDKLSLNFQDIEVRSVLQLIADFTELNLVASDTVSGRITLRLDNVPWDQALDLVLKTKGLDKRQIGNVLMVAPAAEIAERERQELETKRQLEELAPLRTEYIRVRYANAKELFELFKGKRDSGGAGRDFGGSNNSNSDKNSTGSLLSERGRAIVDERTNSIILTDTEEKITEFKKVIAEVDIPIRQVMIEARIVIANTDFREELGIKWGGVALKSNSNGDIGGITGSQEQLDSNNLEYGLDPNGDPVWTKLELTNSNLVDLGVNNAAGMLTAFINTDSAFINMELSALEDSGHAEIVSQPKVITGDKQKATIMSGTEIPYQEASSSGATTTSFKEAVLKLDVTPQITPDNHIIMELQIHKDSVGEITPTGIPSIDVTQLNTKVLAADGETIVLGGIFQTEQVKGVTKVPFLGDIPYLGRAFRKDVTSENKTELLIFITPRIMADNFAQ